MFALSFENIEKIEPLPQDAASLDRAGFKVTGKVNDNSGLLASACNNRSPMNFSFVEDGKPLRFQGYVTSYSEDGVKMTATIEPAESPYAE